MRVLLSLIGSRGDVEPMMALAVQLRALGAGAGVRSAGLRGRIAEFGVPMVPVGSSVRELMHGPTPPSREDAPRVAELLAAQFETVSTAAEDCDAVLATAMMPACEWTIANELGIGYLFACFTPRMLPSPHHTPVPRPGQRVPPGADNRALWDVDAERVQALFGPPVNAHRASMGLPPMNNIRDLVFTDQPWLASDLTLAPWPGSPDLDVVQTGAWIVADERPLPAELAAFLDAGTPPVYVTFGSVPAPKDAARVAIGAIRAQGRRVLLGRGWANLAPIDDRDDCLAVGEVNHQSLFKRVAAVVHHGGAGTTTAAAKAGAPQVVVPGCLQTSRIGPAG